MGREGLPEEGVLRAEIQRKGPSAAWGGDGKDLGESENKMARAGLRGAEFAWKMSWTTSEVPKKGPEAALRPGHSSWWGPPKQEEPQQQRGGRKGDVCHPGWGILVRGGKAMDPGA